MEHSSINLSIYQRLAMLLILCASLFWAFSSQTPSPQDYQSEELGEFSQKRALAHLKIISQAPHPVGSAAHPEVRDYIVSQLEALGLEVQLQKQTAARWHGSFRSAMTHNIVARLRGSGDGPALGLLSHYDSGTYSYGASDAGSGVVTLLEGLRAFMESNPTPKNDIVVVITDAEEIGLVGAQAFVEFHPWAKTLGLMLNFEARGSGGPSYMLIETNSGNSKLIEHFSRADITNPQANSLMYGIYKRLPNDTDLTVFREVADIKGFNFAFIDDHFDYHTAQDTFANLDLETLNHQAQYLMATLEYFADINLSQLESKDESVYFTAPGIGMLYYPVDWSFGLLLLASLGLIGLFTLGHRKGQLSIKGSLLSFIPLGITLIGAYAIALGINTLASQFPQYADIPHGFPYFAKDMMWAGLAATTALSLALYHFAATRLKIFSPLDLLIAPLLLWWLLNLAIHLYLPLAGFFILPMLLALIALASTIYSQSRLGILLPLLMLIPTTIIFMPLVPSFTIGLGLNMLWVSTMLLCCLWSLFAPAITNLRLHLPILLVLCVITVGCVIQASNQTGYSHDRKKPSSVNYVHNLDTQEFNLLSYNHQLDSFTEQFFSAQDRLNDDALDTSQLYPINGRRKPTFVSRTDKLELLAPQVSQHINPEDNGLRLVLDVIPQRPSQLLQIGGAQGLTIRQITINDYDSGPLQDQPTIGQRGLLLSHFLNQASNPSHIEVLFNTTDPADLKNLSLYEVALDLAEQLPSYKSRPGHTMAEPFLINDATIIRKNIGTNQN